MLIEVICDGAARGQGTKDINRAACGVIVYKNEKEIARFGRGLGPVTNNVAEYEAVISALLYCWAAEFLSPIIYSDSAVVVNQINGKWKCNRRGKNSLYPYLLTIQELQRVYSFTVRQIPRKYVAEADAWANTFLDKLDEGLLYQR